MRFTNTKWPRWLVPNCVSKPSSVWPKGVRITPALAITTSKGRPSASKCVCAGAHAFERGEIQFHQREAAAIRGLGPHICSCALRLGQIACSADHVRAMRRQRASRFHAQPGGHAGDENALALEIDALENFIGG